MECNSRKMDILSEIRVCNRNCNEIRNSLDNLSTRLDFNVHMKSEIDRLQTLLQTELAFRNGLAHALGLLDVLTDEQKTCLALEDNIPDRFLRLDFRRRQNESED